MRYFILFTLSLILLTGCQKLKMNIPDTGRKLAINGLITTDELLNLRISKSLYINSLEGDDYFSIYDLDSAEVRFYQNNNFIDSLYHIFGSDYMDWWYVFPKGNYGSKTVNPLPGHEYKVVAKFPGLPTASATTVIPNLVKIENVDSLRITLASGSYYESNLGMQFKIKFSDPANESNFYLFRMYTITYYDPFFGSSVPSRTDVLLFDSEDPIIEERIYQVNGLQSVVFSDKVINGQTYNLDVIVKAESIGNPLFPGIYSSYTENRKTIYFKLYSITGEYFRYIQSLYQYSKTYGNPLAEPVIVNSNVNGGYGMFSGAAVSTDSIVFQY